MCVYSKTEEKTYRCLLSLEDEELMFKCKWYIHKGNSHTPYVIGDKVGGIHLSVIKNMCITVMPKCVIDHKNLNGLDNRRENLRVVDNSINKRNTEYYSNGGDLPLGITFENGKYPRYRVKWSGDTYIKDKKKYKNHTKSFFISHYNSSEEALQEAIKFNEKIRGEYYNI